MFTEIYRIQTADIHTVSCTCNSFVEKKNHTTVADRQAPDQIVEEQGRSRESLSCTSQAPKAYPPPPIQGLLWGL